MIVSILYIAENYLVTEREDPCIIFCDCSVDISLIQESEMEAFIEGFIDILACVYLRVDLVEGEVSEVSRDVQD